MKAEHCRAVSFVIVLVVHVAAGPTWAGTKPEAPERSPETLFAEAEKGLPEYLKIDCSVSGKEKASAAFEYKAARLKELEALYMRVIGKDTTGLDIAAAVRVGELYESFVRCMTLENPFRKKCETKGGVWCEAMKKHESTIKDLVEPQLEHALRFYRLAVKTGKERDVSNSWTKAAEAGVKRLASVDEKSKAPK